MSKRLFTGFKIKPELTFSTFYLGLQKELQGEKIKWVEPWNLHVTLWFFGDIADKDIPDIEKQLHKACTGIKPFMVKIRGCGSFGPSKNPSVIWFGLEVPGTLKQLFANIKERLTEIGYLAEDREFRPHLTLGRIKGIRDVGRMKAVLRTVQDMEFQVTTVNSFSLFESKLTAEGPIYTELKIFNLVNDLE